MNLTIWAMFSRTTNGVISKRMQQLGLFKNHVFVTNERFATKQREVKALDSKSIFGQRYTSVLTDNLYSRAEDGRRRARNKKSLQTGAESEILDIPNIAESNVFCGYGLFQSLITQMNRSVDMIVQDICGLEKDETELIAGAWMIMEAFVEEFLTQINSLFMIDSRLLSLERKTGLFFSVFDRGRRWKKSTVLQLGKEFSSNDAGDGPIPQKRKRVNSNSESNLSDKRRILDKSVLLYVLKKKCDFKSSNSLTQDTKTRTRIKRQKQRLEKMWPETAEFILSCMNDKLTADKSQEQLMEKEREVENLKQEVKLLKETNKKLMEDKMKLVSSFNPTRLQLSSAGQDETKRMEENTEDFGYLDDVSLETLNKIFSLENTQIYEYLND